MDYYDGPPGPPGPYGGGYGGVPPMRGGYGGPLPMRGGYGGPPPMQRGGGPVWRGGRFGHGGPGRGGMNGAMGAPLGGRKKSLLIGINYVGSQHQLEGCQQDVENVRYFLDSQGYSRNEKSQVVLRDDRQTDPRGPFFPTGRNMMNAMNWLVSEPGTTNFLHYSGHGGQVPDQDGTRSSGFNDTIVPVDFERNGQIPSGMLHRTLVTRLPPNSTLFMIFDCCHSGSAVELPFIYRSDEDGNVSMMDNVKEGMRLLGAANNLIESGFNMDSIGDARALLGGASSFFSGLTHQGDDQPPGLQHQEFADQYEREKNKNIVMFSGCRDDQTSADAAISGAHVGAMSWAFLETMRLHGVRQSYIQVLQNTRHLLRGKYTQVPQLSVQHSVDLDRQILI